MGLFDWLKKKFAKKIPEAGSAPEGRFLYSVKELDEYESFIQKNFGDYQSVLHEIFSPDIHLDVILVPPTDGAPFRKLITMGMGAYRMNVPEQFAEYELEHSELIIYLPPDWKIDSPDEKDYWPIRMLKSIARLPIDCDTWLAHGHTVHGNAEQSPFAENIGFNSFILLNGLNLDFNRLDLRLSSGKKINFYQLFPLYQEELDYKLSHSSDELLELLDDDLDYIIDVSRKNRGITSDNTDS